MRVKTKSCWIVFQFFLISFLESCNSLFLYPTRNFVTINASRKFNLYARKIYEMDEVHLSKVLIVESGFGCDQHGQSSTKAAVRACRNAIEFNSLPGLRDVIPGGKENMIVSCNYKHWSGRASYSWCISLRQTSSTGGCSWWDVCLIRDRTARARRQEWSNDLCDRSCFCWLLIFNLFVGATFLHIDVYIIYYVFLTC